MPVPESFRSQGELLDFLVLLEDRVIKLEAENVELRTRFDIKKKELETELEMGAKHQALIQAVQDSLPQTGLLSESFLTRAFAVWGHYFVAQLLIGVVITAVYVLAILVLIPLLNGGR
jgi:cell division septum initiation protein DivIVA